MAGTTTQFRAGVVIADRYRVIDRLGHGGMATVFLAEDQVLSRQVAVKRLHTAVAEGGAERFKREAQLGAALNHPNIVAVYDTLSGPDGVLIVMEYVPGQPFSGLIAVGPMEPGEAIRILRDVAGGLDYAHLQGVVHRDVKPANILVRDDGVVKLSDLGVATAAHVSRITATHDVLGTLGYIAPERLDGEPGGPPADVYSLAAVAFEVLSGQRPQRGATPAEALRRSVAEPPPDLRESLASGPGAAAAVLGRGLDAEPGSASAQRRPPDRGARGGAPARRRRHGGGSGARAGADHRFVRKALADGAGRGTARRRGGGGGAAPGRRRGPADQFRAGRDAVPTAPATARVRPPNGPGSTSTTTTTTTTRAGAHRADRGRSRSRRSTIRATR